MSELIAPILLAVLSLVLLMCVYMLFRNEWVCKQRLRLIKHHYSSDDWRRDFDATYGTYSFWLTRRFWDWDAVRIAAKGEQS